MSADSSRITSVALAAKIFCSTMRESGLSCMMRGDNGGFSGADYLWKGIRSPSASEVAEVVLEFDSQSLRDPVYERHVARYQVDF